jgi:hypothetical protein
MRRLFSAILLTVAVAASAQAQRRVENAPDPYLHRGTSFVLPTTVGQFRRTNVIEYNADGSDASAQYEMFVDGKSVAIVSVYVYPPAAQWGADDAARCAAAFEGGRAAIVQRFPDAQSTGEGERPAPDRGTKLTGRYAGYLLTGDLFSPRGRIASELSVFCPQNGRWQVKYRVSAPADVPRRQEVDALMRALDWPALFDDAQVAAR